MHHGRKSSSAISVDNMSDSLDTAMYGRCWIHVGADAGSGQTVSQCCVGQLEAACAGYGTARTT